MTAAQQLLASAYAELGFREGALLAPAETLGQHSPGDWIERGEWLSLAKTLEVDRVFFVENNPVVVFASAENLEPDALRQLYNRIWCMARPRFLFLATPGELAVYDLARPPVRPGKPLDDEERQLDVARSIAEVQTRLAAYRREAVESGDVFGDPRLGSAVWRADTALIRDLQEVRARLLEAQLPPRLAHALIGRSIFIRYLEDREILGSTYFEQVASADPAWQKLLAEEVDEVWPGGGGPRSLYPRVLRSKSFTYALFRKLAEDFNGDMFPYRAEEETVVTAQHLEDLRGFLLGDPRHDKLFFFAYQFEVIPIELISAIYEEFHHAEQGRGRTHGSHYTPPELAEFVLSQTLTEERLAGEPRILDPACGSGIFLVEAFRRIVRYRSGTLGRRLSQQELRNILRDQIAGIDINEEAVRVAAFSLYLAFLHYQNPREINERRRLPNLTCDAAMCGDRSKERYDILLVANAFDVAALAPGYASRFTNSCADIVVGNPPWGTAKGSGTEGTEACKAAMAWCRTRKRPVGDKELSQAFIHLALDQLRDGGVAGLLVSSGVFFKQQAKSRAFRAAWLADGKLLHVTNFSHLRHLFFKGTGRFAEACAPFASVLFEKTPFNDPEHRFEYWSPKLTAAAERLQAVVLQKTDMRLLGQADAMRDDRLWKVYWWGSHQDYALLRSLQMNPSLGDLGKGDADQRVTEGQGFKEANKAFPADWLLEYQELPPDAVHRYGPLNARTLRTPPSRVERRGVREVYNGQRIIVRRGISQAGHQKGRIVARCIDEPLCFRNSLHAFRFNGFAEWETDLILGILWSSLARYYFFTTAGSWGGWHHELHQEALRTLPVRFPQEATARDRVLSVVNRLRAWQPQEQTLFVDGLSKAAIAKQQEDMERELDEAVFDLYELTAAERDLIRDMCTYGIDLFYRGQKSDAVKPVDFAGWPLRSGTVRDIPKETNGLSPYLSGFLESWNQQLAPEGEFNWRVIRPDNRASLLAVCFSTQVHGAAPSPVRQGDNEAWSEVLARIDANALTPHGSRRIFIDGLIRSVSDRQITIIKRNEQRLWTASAGREDAEATLHQAIRLQELRDR